MKHRMMKLSSQEIWPDDKYSRAAVYRKRNKWHVYECATYSIKNEKNAKELISEVMEEKRVTRRNVKLVKLKSLIVKIDDTYNDI